MELPTSCSRSVSAFYGTEGDNQLQPLFENYFDIWRTPLGMCKNSKFETRNISSDLEPISCKKSFPVPTMCRQTAEMALSEQLRQAEKKEGRRRRIHTIQVLGSAKRKMSGLPVWPWLPRATCSRPRSPVLSDEPDRPTRASWPQQSIPQMTERKKPLVNPRAVGGVLTEKSRIS